MEDWAKAGIKQRASVANGWGRGGDGLQKKGAKVRVNAVWKE
jgi:hypothetical protein